MKINELITEAATYAERHKALDQLSALYAQFHPASGQSKGFKLPSGNPVAYAKQAKQLVTIAGRATKSWETRWSAGYTYDQIIGKLERMHLNSGQALPFPTGAGQVASAFKGSLARYFQALHATPRSFYARRWTMGGGGSQKDPEHGIEFPTQAERDEAWEHVESHGKKIYLRDPYDRTTPKEYIKLGKFLLKLGSITRGVFSDNPSSEYFIYIQTMGMTKNPLTAVVDITDQQAASLRDIAGTKSANAMAGIQAMINMFKGEEELKKVIATSKKITPGDKAKLDQIIAGAATFQEQNDTV